MSTSHRMFHTARGYVEFENMLSRAEAWVEASVPSVLGYSRSALAKRLIQRMVEVGLVAWIQKCARCVERGQPLPSDARVARFSEFTVGIPSGIVGLHPIFLCRSMAEFLVHWMHVTGIALLALLSRRTRRGAATLLFGVGSESLSFQGDDARFVRFCRNGPVTPLAEAARLIVQTAGQVQSVQPDRFVYGRFPLFLLFQEGVSRPIDFLRFMLQHLRAAGAYVRAVVRFPLVGILGRDFAYHAMVTHLNEQRLIESIVITNSNYTAQPLWMSHLPEKRFLTHMVWYSQNTIPLVYTADPIRTDIPNYRHVYVDVSWVWTESYAAYLRELSIPGEMHAVGPILWYLPPSHPISKESSGDIVFALFDVTPVTDVVAESIGLIRNYYDTGNMTEFIEGTISVCRDLEERTGRRVRAVLKHKRSYNARTHDPRYIALIGRLAAQGVVELVPFETNMYELLAKSDVAVVVPYSSPAYVASALGVRAVYFDPTAELLPTFEVAPHVTFAAGRAELLRVALDTISSSTGSSCAS